MTEADKAEEEIIQAQAQAKAEEERVLNEMKIDAGEDFHKLGLPPGGDLNVAPQYMLVVPGHQLGAGFTSTEQL